MCAADTRGKKILEETGHYSGQLMPVGHEPAEIATDQANTRGGRGRKKKKAPQKKIKAHTVEDLHVILAVLLQSYRELQETGMKWDYKYRGTLYKGLELVFFVAFVKCDGDEGDKLCGHYRSRGLNVQSLCRYCCCTTAEGDDHEHRIKDKTKTMLEKLLKMNTDASQEKLKALSQQQVDNAFYPLRFGLHSDQNIHGATPMEMLHHILLGIFKYLRDIFFEQIGVKSATAQEINSLAKVFGRFFSRQSDRDLPKTNFAKGILEGKIMAKEYCGVLLLMAAILQTAHGRTLLKKKKKGKQFAKGTLLDDWALLVETLLQWEDFLKLDEMSMDHVKRLKEKHRYLMYLLKTIAPRAKGVGYKFMKFHGILHIVEDILAFGVPNNVDTGANESHHKLTKLCAKLTQKDISLFEKQTDDRLVEFLLMDLAMAELDGKTIWEYFVLDQHRGPLKEEEVGQNFGEGTTTGAELSVFFKGQEPSFGYLKHKKREEKWGEKVMKYLLGLKQVVTTKGISNFSVRTEHRRMGEIFRGHPNYRKKGQWNDWAFFDFSNPSLWGPCEIFCFVDFSDAPDDFRARYGPDIVERGVYAVVESSTYDDMLRIETKRPKKMGKRKRNHDPEEEFEYDPFKSDLFRPIVKYTAQNADGIREPVYSLVNVEAIMSTCTVIPDIGSPNIFRYLLMTPRKEWSDLFIKWIKQPHKYDKEQMREDDEEDIGNEADGLGDEGEESDQLEETVGDESDQLEEAVEEDTDAGSRSDEEESEEDGEEGDDSSSSDESSSEDEEESGSSDEEGSEEEQDGSDEEDN